MNGRTVRGVLAAVLTVLVGIFGFSPVHAAILAHWVEFGERGIAEARVITDGPACPAILIDGVAGIMTERAAPSEAFPVRVCTAALPLGVKSASAGGERLPLPVADPKRILVLGDTGCHIKFVWRQACNDPDAWPFAQNAANAASLKPDLVIHVGDYLYRESPCPPEIVGCAGSPYGDNWPTWRADFFTPAAALLAAAPWIVVRGNHEDCERAGKGWRRVLAPGAYDPAEPCVDHEPLYVVQVGDREIAVLDSALAPDERYDPKIAALYRSDFASIARLAKGPTWLTTHRPIWGIYASEGARVIGGNRTLAAASDGRLPAVELQIAGHIHALEVTNYSSGQPPEVIVGNGGDDLSTMTPRDLSGLKVAGAQVADGFSLGGFGFLLLEKDTAGWNMAMYDRAGQVERRCTLRDGRVSCPEK